MTWHINATCYLRASFTFSFSVILSTLYAKYRLLLLYRTDEGLVKESEPLWCKIMWSIGHNVHYETKVLVVSHPSTNNLQHMLFTFQHLQITDTRWGKETWTQYIIYKQLTLDTFVRLSINCVDRSRTRPANIRVEKQHRWLNSTKIII